MRTPSAQPPRVPPPSHPRVPSGQRSPSLFSALSFVDAFYSSNAMVDSLPQMRALSRVNRVWHDALFRKTRVWREAATRVLPLGLSALSSDWQRMSETFQRYQRAVRSLSGGVLPADATAAATTHANKALAWAPNGELVGAYAGDKVEIFDASAQRVMEHTLPKFNNVVAVAWSPCSTKLAIATVTPVGTSLGSFPCGGTHVAWHGHLTTEWWRLPPP